VSGICVRIIGQLVRSPTRSWKRSSDRLAPTAKSSSCDPSAGLAVAGADDSDLHASRLLKHADMAMYSAKRLRGGLQTFSPDMHVRDDTCPGPPGIRCPAVSWRSGRGAPAQRSPPGHQPSCPDRAVSAEGRSAKHRCGGRRGAYLRKLPIDEIKVDQDLIGNVLTDPRAEAIVRAVIDLAHSLNVTTVAEGVENVETAAWLRNCGCEVAQGILYSPPITAAAMMELIAVPAPR
jgi:hypothetical protein